MKKTILTIIILLLATFAIAYPVTFSPNPDTYGIIHSSSVMFKMTTPTALLCKYSEYNVSFEEMTKAFDENLETMHKKTLTNLHDGVYRYYVKCRPINDTNNTSSESSETITFKISNPITAVITLGNLPLNAGKHEITLTTTKVPSTTPQLKYSYDGISYSPITLHGSETSWKGYLIIPSSTGEKIGSLKFEARDLEGRLGTQIVGDNIFTVDTKSPAMITSIEATGEYGQIKLKWFLDESEEATKINIYRSENPNIDLTDLYKTLEGTSREYYDTDVGSGKTYYYRISPEDAAGNTADLSREVSSTSLLSKSSQSSSAKLSPSLLGSVDALLSEIELLESEIKSSDDMTSSLSDSEKEYMKSFKIIDNFNSAKSELSSLKQTVENYKLTDMTSETLDGRLNSARIKLNIIRKKIPSTFTITDSIEIAYTSTEESLRKAILEYSPELTPRQIDKTIRDSLKLLKKENLEIKSKLNVAQVTYLDGTTEDYSIIEHFLNSELEKSENSKFILRFPSGSLNLNSLIIKNIDYTPEQEGLISFETDTKKITYTFNQKLDPQTLSEISISLLATPEESLPLTGYFLSNVSTSGSTFATLLILMALGLVGYLFFIKQQQKKEVSSEFLKTARKVKTLQKDGKVEEAKSLYEKLKIEYIGLSDSQKHEVFKEIKNLSKS